MTIYSFSSRSTSLNSSVASVQTFNFFFKDLWWFNTRKFLPFKQVETYFFEVTLTLYSLSFELGILVLSS
jgi:hypothetical protein